ncbi:MAG: hypothetical protein MUC69_04550 [Gemmatimonadales bacterium]|jgi:hypothetical protein|nr:hypothetical protein [Gemmatimonadales bacterium]
MRTDDGRGWLYLGASVFAMTLLGAFTALGMRHGEDFLIPVLLVGGATTAYLAKSEVGKAIAQRIRHGRLPTGDGASPEVYGELDELRSRVLELEERLDFAERLLAQPKDAQLPVGRTEADGG